jgi:tetratricopeptide (TPR) repeat protein
MSESSTGDRTSWRPDAAEERPTSERATEARTAGRVRYITELPDEPPEEWFQDRTNERAHLASLLQRDLIRLVVLYGPDGIGKTAVAVRFCAELKHADPPWIDAVIYSKADGSDPLTTASLLHHLGYVPPIDPDTPIEPLLLDQSLTPAEKLDLALGSIGSDRVLVVIDNVEELLDDDGTFRDADLGEMLYNLASARLRRHQVKVLLITRQRPEALLATLPGNAMLLSLDLGLPQEFAEQFLRDLDRDGRAGLRRADPAHLKRISELTGGHPRALEAFYSILRDSGQRPSARALLEEAERRQPPREVTEFLIGRMFDTLRPAERKVVLALAVYGRRVAPDAVAYLLEPDVSYDDAGEYLEGLVGSRHIRKDGDRYFLPSTERTRVLDAIPRGRPADRGSPAHPRTRLALFHRAAEYFAQHRKDPVERVEDLEAELAEIDLRVAGEEYEAAMDVLHPVDLRHLRRWGYSQLLVPHRLRLKDNLPRDQLELANLDALGNATRQRDDPEEAALYYGAALGLARQIGHAGDLASTYINWGSAYLESGHPTLATAQYRQALDVVKDHRRLRNHEAHAVVGLGLSHVDLGNVQEAVRQYDRALATIDEIREQEPEEFDDDLQVLEVELFRDSGELHGRLGDDQAALERLSRGADLAGQRHLALLEGGILSVWAEVLIDQNAIGHAIQRAEGAARIGERHRNAWLMQQAYSMVALGKLYAELLPEARAAANAAARYPSHRRRLAPSVLQGVIALRGGEIEIASKAFDLVHQRATTLRRKDPGNVGLLDADGLALCGLVLSDDEPAYLDEAVAALKQARASLAPQPAVVNRMTRLLNELARADPAGHLQPARRAASARS